MQTQSKNFDATSRSRWFSMTQLGAQDTMYNSAGGRLGARRSRLLSSTIAATVLFSSCGGAKAQDQPTPQTTPAPAPPPGAPSPTEPPSGQPPAGGTQQRNPNLPPVTVEKPVTRIRRAAPAKPTPQAPPAIVSRPGPTPRVAQRPRPA